MGSKPNELAKNEFPVFRLGFLMLCLAALVPNTVQETNCPTELQCLECNATSNGTYYCTTCADDQGLLIDPPNPTRCIPCRYSCKTCTVIGQRCEQCVAGNGPNYTRNDGSCGPCVSVADYCAEGCDVSGAGRCDGCFAGFGLTNDKRTCSRCVPNCLSCDRNITYCDVCRAGYYKYPNSTCGLCAANCTKYKCQQNGPEKCDRCDDGYALTPTNTCAPCSPNCNVSVGCLTPSTCISCNPGYGLLPNGTCDVSPVTFWSSAMTASTTPVPEISSTRIPTQNTKCPSLEIGLGIGVPCGFIVVVLLIIIIIIFIENRSLRKYKRENQNRIESHTFNSLASNATVQPPSTKYQQLQTQNPNSEYERIDRYDSIRTTGTEKTGTYETPIN